MKSWHHAMRMLLLIALCGLIWAPEAHAYVDPGSGSFILQFIIAALLGAGLTLKMYWQRGRQFLSSLISKRQPDDDNVNR
ncbi:MAG: hypothetical protein NZ823_00240 [Blastocatellia bacterium]|nr:hypothetical protein [Blastocatellia bacterium]